jgi:hypothetical protein
VRNAGRKDVLGNLLNKPIVVTPEQIDNLLIKIDEDRVMSLEDYLCSKIIDTLYTMLRGE